jgi:hypothetical protein
MLPVLLYTLNSTADGVVRCLIYMYFFWDLPAETGNRPRGDVTLASRPSEGESGLYSRFCTGAWCLLCLSLSGRKSSSSQARTVYPIWRDSSQFVSLCIGLLERASGLIALLCISCMVLRLLLICDVESALSVLATAVGHLGRACGVRACFVVSCRVFSKRLDDEVGSLIVHIGPCRWGR